MSHSKVTTPITGSSISTTSSAPTTTTSTRAVPSVLPKHNRPASAKALHLPSHHCPQQQRGGKRLLGLSPLGPPHPRLPLGFCGAPLIPRPGPAVPATGHFPAFAGFRGSIPLIESALYKAPRGGARRPGNYPFPPHVIQQRPQLPLASRNTSRKGKNDHSPNTGKVSKSCPSSVPSRREAATSPIPLPQLATTAAAVTTASEPQKAPASQPQTRPQSACPTPAPACGVSLNPESSFNNDWLAASRCPSPGAADKAANSYPGDGPLCRLYNETISKCLDSEGTYTCKALIPGCYIIQKVEEASSKGATESQPHKDKRHTHRIIKHLENLKVVGKIVAEPDYLYFETPGDICSFERVNLEAATPAEDSCVECSSNSSCNSYYASLSKGASSSQPCCSSIEGCCCVNPYLLSQSLNKVHLQQQLELQELQHRRNSYGTETTQSHKSQVCSVTLASSSYNSRPLEGCVVKHKQPPAAQDSTKKSSQLPPAVEKKDIARNGGKKDVIPPVKTAATSTSPGPNLVSYRSTATYPLRKRPLINTKHPVNSIATITVTPATPLNTATNFELPAGAWQKLNTSPKSALDSNKSLAVSGRRGPGRPTKYMYPLMLENNTPTTCSPGPGTPFPPAAKLLSSQGSKKSFSELKDSGKSGKKHGSRKYNEDTASAGREHEKHVNAKDSSPAVPVTKEYVLYAGHSDASSCNPAASRRPEQDASSKKYLAKHGTSSRHTPNSANINRSEHGHTHGTAPIAKDSKSNATSSKTNASQADAASNSKKARAVVMQQEQTAQQQQPQQPQQQAQVQPQPQPQPQAQAQAQAQAAAAGQQPAAPAPVAAPAAAVAAAAAPTASGGAAAQAFPGGPETYASLAGLGHGLNGLPTADGMMTFVPSSQYHGPPPHPPPHQHQALYQQAPPGPLSMGPYSLPLPPPPSSTSSPAQHYVTGPPPPPPGGTYAVTSQTGTAVHQNFASGGSTTYSMAAGLENQMGQLALMPVHPSGQAMMQAPSGMPPSYGPPQSQIQQPPQGEQPPQQPSLAGVEPSPVTNNASSQGQTASAAAAPAPAATPTSGGPVTPTSSGPVVPLTMDQIKELLQRQLEYYFSRENLAHDSYLISQMDADQYVSIEVIANFNKVKSLTSDKNLIAQILRECPFVQVDAEGQRVKPNHTRCTVILREIPQNTELHEVEELFESEKFPKPTLFENARYGGFWYVSFDSEEDAQKAFNYVTQEVREFKGNLIRARIKTKPMHRLPSTSSPSSTAPHSVSVAAAPNVIPSVTPPQSSIGLGSQGAAASMQPPPHGSHGPPPPPTGTTPKANGPTVNYRQQHSAYPVQPLPQSQPQVYSSVGTSQTQQVIYTPATTGSSLPQAALVPSSMPGNQPPSYALATTVASTVMQPVSVPYPANGQQIQIYVPNTAVSATSQPFYQSILPAWYHQQSAAMPAQFTNPAGGVSVFTDNPAFFGQANPYGGKPMGASGGGRGGFKRRGRGGNMNTGDRGGDQRNNYQNPQGAGLNNGNNMSGGYPNSYGGGGGFSYPHYNPGRGGSRSWDSSKKGNYQNSSSVSSSSGSGAANAPQTQANYPSVSASSNTSSGVVAAQGSTSVASNVASASVTSTVPVVSTATPQSSTPSQSDSPPAQPLATTGSSHHGQSSSHGSNAATSSNSLSDSPEGGQQNQISTAHSMKQDSAAAVAAAEVPAQSVAATSTTTGTSLSTTNTSTTGSGKQYGSGHHGSGHSHGSHQTYHSRAGPGEDSQYSSHHNANPNQGYYSSRSSMDSGREGGGPRRGKGRGGSRGGRGLGDNDSNSGRMGSDRSSYSGNSRGYHHDGGYHSNRGGYRTSHGHGHGNDRNHASDRGSLGGSGHGNLVSDRGNHSSSGPHGEMSQAHGSRNHQPPPEFEMKGNDFPALPMAREPRKSGAASATSTATQNLASVQTPSSTSGADNSSLNTSTGIAGSSGATGPSTEAPTSGGTPSAWEVNNEVASESNKLVNGDLKASSSGAPLVSIHDVAGENCGSKINSQVSANDGKQRTYAQIAQKKKEEREAKEAAEKAAAAAASGSLSTETSVSAEGSKNIVKDSAVKPAHQSRDPTSSLDQNHVVKAGGASGVASASTAAAASPSQLSSLPADNSEGKTPTTTTSKAADPKESAANVATTAATSTTMGTSSSKVANSKMAFKQASGAGSNHSTSQAVNSSAAAEPKAATAK